MLKRSLEVAWLLVCNSTTIQSTSCYESQAVNKYSEHCMTCVVPMSTWYVYVNISVVCRNCQHCILAAGLSQT